MFSKKKKKPKTIKMHKCKKYPCPKPAACKCRTVREANIPIIWLIGGSGSGKRLHGVPLAKQTNLDFLSLGDIIRDEISTRSKRGVEWEKLINLSESLPSEDIINLLEQIMNKRLKDSRGYIVSFVRNIEQTEIFENYIAPVDMIIYLECSDETMRARADKNEADNAAPENETAGGFEKLHETIDAILRKYKDIIETVDCNGSIEETYAQLPPLVEKAIIKKLESTPVPTCD